MATKTPERVNEWKRPSIGNLPPLVILGTEVDDASALEAKLVSIDPVTFGKGKNAKEAWYYRFELSSQLNAFDKGGEEQAFTPGSVVSLRGSGQFDYLMKTICLDLIGNADKEVDDVTLDDMEVLHDHNFRIQGQPSEKMTKGPYKGKDVKKFDIQYR